MRGILRVSLNHEQGGGAGEQGRIYRNRVNRSTHFYLIHCTQMKGDINSIHAIKLQVVFRPDYEFGLEIDKVAKI